MSRWPLRSVGEILHAAPEDLAWYAHPLILPGTIAVLAGEAKSSGKTTLLLSALAAMHASTPFLGRPTLPTSCLYLSEESAITLRQAVRRTHLSSHAAVRFLLRHDLGPGLSWAALMVAVRQLVRTYEFGVVVIDTWSEFTMFPADDENLTGPVRQALLPLRDVTAQGVAVVILHHWRKDDAGSIVKSLRGSSALAGACDIIGGLRKREDGGRQLEVLSRFDTASGLWTVPAVTRAPERERRRA